jgi:NADH-quinone oxidoreductase subunit N
MSGNFVPSGAELMRFLPEIILSLAGTLLMVLAAIRPESRRALAVLAFIALVLAMGSTFAAQSDPGTAFSAMLVTDGFGTFFRVLVIGIGMLTILISTNYLSQERANSGEFFALLLFSITGQCLMATANDLVMLFIGLEASSISSYVMAGYLRDDKRNNEAALKYFLLGSFATAFLLYGVAWTYGLTGSVNLSHIRQVLLNPSTAPDSMLVSFAAGLLFIGLAFKVTAAPFQMWAPDVYQGAPAPVSAFMSVGPKAAAFAMLVRIFATAFEPLKDRWEPVLWCSALATMLIGNLAALRQHNIKRLLAYSSIAHAGYIMVAVTARSEIGTSAIMFYLCAYALTQIGAFAVVTHIARRGERYVEIADFAGLGQRQPVTAALLTIFLLSLIGVPLTGGFFGKFYIFKAALDSSLVWLTVFGLLNSALAAYYYLRVVVVMYMQAPADGAEPLPPLAPGVQVALWASAAATLALGIFPSALLDFAGKSASFIR